MAQNILNTTKDLLKKRRICKYFASCRENFVQLFFYKICHLDKVEIRPLPIKSRTERANRTFAIMGLIWFAGG